MNQPDFSNADWAQIHRRPGQVQHVEGVGPAVFFDTGKTESEVRRLVAGTEQQLCRETSLEGLDKKRPLIDRTYLIDEAGYPVSVRQASHQKFREWAIDYLKRAGYASIDWGNPDTSAVDREQVLMRMVQDGISPLMKRE